MLITNTTTDTIYGELQYKITTKDALLRLQVILGAEWRLVLEGATSLSMTQIVFAIEEMVHYYLSSGEWPDNNTEPEPITFSDMYLQKHSPPGKIAVSVALQEVSSGRIVRYLDKYPDEEDVKHLIQYMWEEGNYSCNCNRHSFFERALRGDPDYNPVSHECGDGAYKAFIVVDGEVLLDDCIDFKPEFLVDKVVPCQR